MKTRKFEYTAVDLELGSDVEQSLQPGTPKDHLTGTALGSLRNDGIDTSPRGQRNSSTSGCKSANFCFHRRMYYCNVDCIATDSWSRPQRNSSAPHLTNFLFAHSPLTCTVCTRRSVSRDKLRDEQVFRRLSSRSLGLSRMVDHSGSTEDISQEVWP